MLHALGRRHIDAAHDLDALRAQGRRIVEAGRDGSVAARGKQRAHRGAYAAIRAGDDPTRHALSAPRRGENPDESDQQA